MNNKEFFEIHAVDYLSDELPQQQRIRFEQILAENPQLHDELKSIKQTLAILSEFDASSETVARITPIHNGMWLQKGLAAAMVILALAFSYRVIHPTIAAPTADAPEQFVTSEALEQITQANLIAFSSLLAEERVRQDELLRAVLTEFSADIEARRMIDMQLIQYEMELQAYRSNQQFYTTGTTLNNLIDYLSLITE